METFVLRVWRPDVADVAAHAPALLRGVVEQLATGERHPFQNGAELVLFLSAVPNDRGFAHEGDYA
jgi:hypothetical protein